MKVNDSVRGLEFVIPDEFAVSNEVWPDVALGLVAGAQGDACAVIGSGNAPNIVPMISELEMVTFMDISSGHGEIFKAKLSAVRSAGSLSYNLGSAFAGALVSEAGLFDLLRSPQDAQHFLDNTDKREEFAKLSDEIIVTDKSLNILDGTKAVEVNEGAERLAWLHLSNVVPYCVERGAKDVERKLFGFIDDMPGVDDETVVTFSRRADIDLGDMNIRRLLVTAKRLDDIGFDDFLNKDSMNFSPGGELIVSAVA